MALKRRDFIKSACNICLLGSVGMLTASLAGCSATHPVFKTEVSDNKLIVPINLFAQSPLQVVRPKGMLSDIAVHKKEEHIYVALLLVCTHQQNQLTVTGNGYVCNLHGSEFTKDGTVRKGPAEKHLKQFNTFISGNDLIIQL